MTPATAATHTRENLSVLARSEKRALIWIARRLPNSINSDHLSDSVIMAIPARWYLSASSGAGFFLSTAAMQQAGKASQRA